MRSRISIRGSVRPSVRLSVRPSVRPSVPPLALRKYERERILWPCVRPCSMSDDCLFLRAFPPMRDRVQEGSHMRWTICFGKDSQIDVRGGRGKRARGWSRRNVRWNWLKMMLMPSHNLCWDLRQTKKHSKRHQRVRDASKQRRERTIDW